MSDKKTAKIIIPQCEDGKQISPYMFGSFIEHVGRCVYGGVYTPDSSYADECGFNSTLIEECRDMKLPLVRYPGGSYVSTWDWKNSIGPKKDRKATLNHPWHEIEPNTVGLGEAVEWCKKVGCELLLCLNITTASLVDILNLVEYCNYPSGTYWSDLRRSHGYEQPFGIKYWSLGNEPDGWWQMNLMPSTEYARLTREVAKAIKWIEPDAKLIACSSVGGNMEWTKATLLDSYKYIDLLSVHDYIANKDNNFEYYMANASRRHVSLQKMIDLCDEVKNELSSDKTVNISYDEWNVWYHSIEADKNIPFWRNAPHRLEDVYNLEDALAVAEYIITMLKNSDRIEIGCMAQLVNVLGVFLTDEKGKLLRQTTYYPYSDACRYGRGTALIPEVKCDKFSAENKGVTIEGVDVVSAAATKNDGVLALFVVNRSLNDDIECSLHTDGLNYNSISAKTLYHDDIKAINTFDNPDNVVYSNTECKVEKDTVSLTLKKHSFTLVLMS